VGRECAWTQRWCAHLASAEDGETARVLAMENCEPGGHVGQRRREVGSNAKKISWRDLVARRCQPCAALEKYSIYIDMLQQNMQ
jgi:hypothetical protein